MMNESYSDKSRQIWNQRHERSREQGVQHQYAPWLERWLGLFDRADPAPVLDLGCGSGFDSQYLTGQGFRVVASDFSRQALLVARRTAPQASLLELDIRAGLPFPEGVFKAIIANLSLHYFPWDQTCAVLGEVRKRLKTGGCLLMRVNSIHDDQYGAASGQVVERNCRIVEGVLKRFFEREDAIQLFARDWKMLGLEEQIVTCYGKPKALWEIVAQRTE